MRTAGQKGHTNVARQRIITRIVHVDNLRPYLKEDTQTLTKSSKNDVKIHRSDDQVTNQSTGFIFNQSSDIDPVTQICLGAVKLPDADIRNRTFWTPNVYR